MHRLPRAASLALNTLPQYTAGLRARPSLLPPHATRTGAMWVTMQLGSGRVPILH